jgi:hypothetical protein
VRLYAPPKPRKRLSPIPFHSFRGIALSGLKPTPPSIIQLGGVVRFRALGAAHIRAARPVGGRFFFFLLSIERYRSKLGPSATITGAG